MRFIVLFVSSLYVLCAACATTSNGEEARASTPPVAPSAVEPKASLQPFAWPVGSSAVVTEYAMKRGQAAKLQYRIDVGAREGGALSVQLKELEFIEIPGIDLKDPKHAVMVEALERKTMAVLPSFLIGADGQFEDMADYDRLIEFATEREPEDRRAVLRKAMRGPATRALLRDGVSKIWSTWAGVWVGQALASGHVTEVDMVVKAGEKTYTFPARFEHRGPAADVPGHVELTFTTTQEGDAAAAATRATLGGLGALTAQDPKTAEQLQAATRDMKVSKIVTIRATVDPSTLLPLRCESNEVTTLVIEGQQHKQLEAHRYDFAWTLPAR